MIPSPVTDSPESSFGAFNPWKVVGTPAQSLEPLVCTSNIVWSSESIREDVGAPAKAEGLREDVGAPANADGLVVASPTGDGELVGAPGALGTVSPTTVGGVVAGWIAVVVRGGTGAGTLVVFVIGLLTIFWLGRVVVGGECSGPLAGVPLGARPGGLLVGLLIGERVVVIPGSAVGPLIGSLKGGSLEGFSNGKLVGDC